MEEESVWALGVGTVYGEPFVEVFSFGEEDCLFEVSGSEDSGCIAFELGCFGAFLDGPFRLECVACAGVSTIYELESRQEGVTSSRGRTL